MDTTIKKRPDVRFLCCYVLLLFVSAWTRDFGLAARMSASPLGSVPAAFVEPLWKGIFWIAPIVLYITFVEKQPVLEYLKLNKHIGKGLLWGLAGSLFFFLQLVSPLLHRVPIQLHHSWNDWLNGVILVGFIEEIIFRGFLFQQFEHLLVADKAQEKSVGHELQGEAEEVGEEVSPLVWITDWAVDWASRSIPNRPTFLAATLSTAIFVAIHFPSWILLGVPAWLMLTTSLANVVLGYLSCALLRISGSLWSCILMHSLNDLIVLLLA